MTKKILVLFLASSLFFVSCKKDDDEKTSPSITGIQFTEISAPTTDTEKTSVRIAPSVTVTYSDGSTQNYPLEWKVLAKSGDTIGTNLYKYGQTVDKDGDVINAILDDASATYSNNPDGMTIYQSGSDYYLLTQFEDRPGVIYNTKMSLANGEFTAVSTAPFNPTSLASIGGTHTNCASSKTPWGSHLAPEEDYDMDGITYSTDATAKTVATNNSDYGYKHVSHCGTINEDTYFCPTAQGQANYLEVALNAVNPYLYGYNFEISMTNPAAPSLVGDMKHYVFGKYTPENAVVLSDKKTVIITDDGPNRGVYKFVATTAEDLSAGTLYAMKLSDGLSDSDLTADISWVELGTSSNTALKTIIDKKPDWTDMWEVNVTTDRATCEALGGGTGGWKMIYAGDFKTCVRPKDGTNGTVSTKFADAAEAKLALGFLETRRYAAYLGATIEWNKGEAVAYDKDRNVVWFGVTDISKSMQDRESSLDLYSTTEMIKFSKNSCGGVFKMNLDANSSPTSIELVFKGTPITADAAGNTCDPNNISGPDNVRYIGYDTLLIGEDTSGHKNNMAWAYNISTKTLTRILTGPLKAEITGMFAEVNAGGNFFIFTGIQHPGDTSTYAFGTEERKGITGYIKGMPALNFTAY